MASEDLLLRLGLKGQAETSRGLKSAAGDTRALGTAAETAGAKARAMGASFSTAGRSAGAGLAVLGRGARYGALGLAGLVAAGTKWGLSFNAQVENARLRFSLFTSDVDGLTRSVQQIDMASMFNFADLADSAAMLGGSGVQDVPKTLQAIANAAAAGGKGTEGLKAISLAMSQIASKGRLSQEEVNQLTEGGAVTAQRDLAKGLGLTAKQLQNLGGEGIEASKALDVLTKAWTTGQMADIAERQTRTLGGQWSLFTGNMQKASGAATTGLARGLERDVLPAANRAVEQITRIMGDEGLSNEAKLRKARDAIRRELGPIADDLLRKIDDADIAGKLSSAFESAMSRVATVAANQAPHVVKAFVDAWLGAGPWAKLISGAWLAHKLGLDKGALALLKGGGKGAAGGLGGAVSKGQPIPVWVVNNGPMPGRGGIKDTVKKVATGAAASRAAMLARGGVALGAEGIGAGALPAGAAFGGILGLALTHNENFPTRGPGASSPSNPGGHVPFVPGGMRRETGEPVVVNPVVQAFFQVDGRTLAMANATANAKKKARK